MDLQTLQEHLQKFKSDTIIQQFIHTKSKTSSIFRVIVQNDKVKIYLVVPRMISETLVSKFASEGKLDRSFPNKFSGDKLQGDHMQGKFYSKEFMKHQYGEKQITKCRESALEFLEKMSLDISNLFNSKLCRPEGYQLMSIALDFIQGKRLL